MGAGQRAQTRSPCSTVNHSRKQWKGQATQRGAAKRSLRKQSARIKAEREQATQALTETHARFPQLASQVQAMAMRPTVDVVCRALRLFFEVRISLRAVCRVLRLLAAALGITKAPCPQSVSHWVMRLSLGRIASARELRGVPLSHAPFSNGLIWLIDRSLGLGSGTLGAVFALDAPHHHLAGGAPSLAPVHCIAVSVADAWSGDAIAALLQRRIAPIGRPAAALKDGGSAWHKAADVFEPQGLASPCMDAISHAAAHLLTHASQHHPAFERFLSACGRVSGQLTHTLLASLAPPTVRTTARCMHVHRLCTWAERRLQLSPPGRAKAGSR